MSETQSDLSSPKYGYDFVVATTQESINATMKQYLSSPGAAAPMVTQCYVMDENGNPQAIDYQALLKATGGVDPFSVANGAPPTDAGVKALAQASFLYAFRAQIGIPAAADPLSVPDIVILGMNTASVTFNLMCSTFQIVEATYGPRGIVSYLNQSQDPSAPWLFTSKVDLRLTVTDQSAYSKLPPPVQQSIKNLGGNAFSVQQLLFDLDNAALESIPTISGVAPGTPLYTALQTSFLGAYFAAVRAQGQPVLGYAVSRSVIDQASLSLTDLNFQVSAFVGSDGQPVVNPTPQQTQLATLCYLCAANGDTLPAATPFTWNWVEPDQVSSFHGVAVVNRNSLAKYFRDQLMPAVEQNCLQPNVRVWLSGFLDSTVNYSWGVSSFQTPTVQITDTGADVLTFRWNSSEAEDQAGLNGDMGRMTMSSSLAVDVSFQGNTIVVVQHLIINVYIRSLATSEQGNIIDITLTDTYTLAVDQNGGLTATVASTKADNSESPSVNGFLNFFTGANDLMNSVKTWASGFASTNFQDMPLSAMQSFVFPGGQTFVFKDVLFSQSQDLVSHITYADPT